MWCDTHKEDLYSWLSIQTSMVWRFDYFPNYESLNILRKVTWDSLNMDIYNEDSNPFVFVEFNTQKLEGVTTI